MWRKGVRHQARECSTFSRNLRCYPSTYPSSNAGLRWTMVDASVRAAAEEQRIRAGGHRETLRQARAGPATEREPDVIVQLPQPLRSARRRTRNAGKALGEGSSRTGRPQTPKPPHTDAKGDRSPLPG